jgi:hypothetical protein
MISYLIDGSLIAAAGRVSNTVIRPEPPHAGGICGSASFEIDLSRVLFFVKRRD